MRENPAGNTNPPPPIALMLYRLQIIEINADLRCATLLYGNTFADREYPPWITVNLPIKNNRTVGRQIEKLANIRRHGSFEVYLYGRCTDREYHGINADDLPCHTIHKRKVCRR